MNDYATIKQEIEKMIKSGEKIHNALLPVAGKEVGSKDLSYFIINDEPWYTNAYHVVTHDSPDRLTDFTSLYNNTPRKEMKGETY